MLKKLVPKIIDHNQYDLLLKQSTKVKISIADHYFQDEQYSEDLAGVGYRELLDEYIDGSKSSAYALLSKLGCRIITTNYDTLFVDAIKGKVRGDLPGAASIENTIDEIADNSAIEKKENYVIKSSIDHFEMPDLVDRKLFLHLHGSVKEKKTIVASSLSYIELYGKEINVEKLKKIFENQVVVFIGYGLEELELLEIIVKVSGETKNEKRKYFMLLPLLSHEFEVFDQLEIHYKKLGIHLIPYSRDKEGFEGLTKIISNWYETLAPLSDDERSRDSKLGVAYNIIEEFRGALKNEG